MSGRYPVLYLPSEIHNRDWDARLLIADYASALGFTSIVGQQWVLHFDPSLLPPGLMLVKTINEIQLTVAKVSAGAGSIVAAMDEEYLAVAPDQDFIGVLPARLPDVCDVFFANSPLHAKLLERKLPKLAGKVEPLGNPRLDLLVSSGRIRYAPQVAQIRAEIGPFILFNSNLAQKNSIWDSKENYLDIQVRAGALDPNDAESIERLKQQFDFERNNSHAFMSALRWCLENVKGHRVVVRPHPVERSQYWQELAREYPRLYIAENTHHVPWMLAADAILHTNSTTGVEAAFLERPTINLVPNASGHWENIYIGTRVNPTFENWRDATDALKEFLSTGRGPLNEIASARSELERYFPNAFDGLAAQRIAHRMVDMVRAGEMASEPFDLLALRGKLPRLVIPPALQQKFSKDFRTAVADFDAVRAITRLSHPVAIRKVADGCFAIGPA